MDSSRLRTGEIVAGIGGAALFLFLFFDWFSGAPELSGNIATGATISRPGVSGWDALTDLPGFLIMLSGVAGLALLYLGAAGQRVNIPVRRGAITALLGALAVLLILWRMVVGSPTLRIGVFLGLGAAIAITAGALMALREDGFEPLVAVAGGPARTASASAPGATPARPTEEVPAAPAKRSASGGSRSGGSRSSSSRSGGSTTKRSTTKKPATRSRPKSGSRASSSRSGSSRSKSSGSRSSSPESRSSSRSGGSRSGGGKRPSSRKK